MAIVLSILKVLGIILGIILAAAVILVLLVLLVPIRYSAEGKISDPEPHEEPPGIDTIKNTASGRIGFHWLLYLIRGGISYPDDPAITVKVLWFTVFRKEFAAAKSSKEEQPEAAEPVKVPQQEASEKNESPVPLDENTEESDNTAASANEDTNEKDEAPEENTDSVTSEINDEPSSEKEEKETIPKESLIDRIDKWIAARRYQWNSICDKIKHISRDFRYYWNIVSSPEFSEALSRLLKALGKLLPRKWSAEGTIGLGDPEKAGNLLEILGVAYPVTAGHVNIAPEFYLYQTDIAVSMKGKIRLITLGLVLLDKNVRKVIRGFMRKNGKKEKKKHG